MRVGQVATPAAIWAHPTRNLTNPVAAQDLSNMRVGLASGYYPTDQRESSGSRRRPSLSSARRYFQRYRPIPIIHFGASVLSMR